MSKSIGWSALSNLKSIVWSASSNLKSIAWLASSTLESIVWSTLSTLKSIAWSTSSTLESIVWSTLSTLKSIAWSTSSTLESIVWSTSSFPKSVARSALSQYCLPFTGCFKRLSRTGCVRFRSCHYSRLLVIGICIALSPAAAAPLFPLPVLSAGATALEWPRHYKRIGQFLACQVAQGYRLLKEVHASDRATTTFKCFQCADEFAHYDDLKKHITNCYKAAKCEKCHGRHLTHDSVS